MLSRKFYDILSIIFVLLIIIISIGGWYYTKSLPIEKLFLGSIIGFNTILLIIQFLAGIYYIFILVLAIQLHSKKALSTTDTVVTAIIVPFSIFFYLFTLRKALKKYERT